MMRPPAYQDAREWTVLGGYQQGFGDAPALPSFLALAAAVIRCGRVAFIVLYEPRTSMSMTDLKALALSWDIGARKLPAAPALS